MTQNKADDAAERGIDVETELEVEDLQVGDELAVRRVSQTGSDRWELSKITEFEEVGFFSQIHLDGNRSFVDADDLNEDAFLPGEFEG